MLRFYRGLVLQGLLLCGITLLPVSLLSGEGFYDGTLLFIDDYRGLEFQDFIIHDFGPCRLIRSWYRWGKPHPSKSYSLRGESVKRLKESGILVGGGGSLSLVNELDLESQEFSRQWLSRNMDGSVFRKNGYFYGSLSHPGFRKYIIDNAVEQVRQGAVELHFGETNGEIHYDDWTIGIRGDSGFIHWLRKAFAGKSEEWWEINFGDFGKTIFSNGVVTRGGFTQFTKSYPQKFASLWGVEGSWKGFNRSGKSAFLSYLYCYNLNSFIGELRQRLKDMECSHVQIDVWGSSLWIAALENKPDAIIEKFPGREWGVPWEKTGVISGSDNLRITQAMKDILRKARPVRVVWAIDHPEPFTAFSQLPDASQALLWKYFSDKCHGLQCNLIVRSYSNCRKRLGKSTRAVLKEISHEFSSFSSPAKE